MVLCTLVVVSGRRIPAAVLVGATIFSTSTRSSNGFSLLAVSDIAPKDLLRDLPTHDNKELILNYVPRLQPMPKTIARKMPTTIAQGNAIAECEHCLSVEPSTRCCVGFQN